MIRNIWAVGRNYADHAKELGNKLPSSPLIFLKAGSAATLAAASIELHSGALEVHHEVELALRFNDQLEISEACVALDLTDRPRQIELKTRGEAWTLAKSFKGSCPVSKFFSISSLDEVSDLEITLDVDGHRRQSDRTSSMLFSLPFLRDYVKTHFPVCPGDLLLTGTPAGVGQLTVGQRVVASLGNKISHSWVVVAQK